jgi:hypothetical protein
MCTTLLKRPLPEGPTHDKKMDELRRHFPKAKRWIDWWTMPNIQSLLFPSCGPSSEEHPNGNNGQPDTTNAQESMHRLYYMFR